ncbi:MAG: type IV pilus modification PilV family protein, partial [Gaiellaceae bacterium]
RSRLLPARIRDERGFGMVELLAAMTVMLVGVLAVFSLFQAGILQIRRASTATTAAALADAEMEKFRAIKYETLGLDPTQTCPSGCSGADDVYKGDTAYAADSGPATTLSGSLLSTATTLTVTSAAGFPASAEFRVTIGSEILLVTAGGSGTTSWTVERGLDGTTPAAQNAGAPVTLKQRVDLASCSSAVPAPDPCSNLVPTKTSVGADGKSYRVDTYVTWTEVANDDGTAGRAVKRITVVVRDSTAPHTRWARVTSIFDESTGL